VLFARGISPVQNWWRNLLGKDISCSQWEGPSMHSRCLAFFPFKVFLGCGGGERNYFHVSLVPNVFSMGSHQIPNMFPNMFSIHTSLLSHILWQMLSVFHLSPIQLGQKGGPLYFKIEPGVIENLLFVKMKSWKLDKHVLSLPRYYGD
jgi:hypothetical protein